MKNPWTEERIRDMTVSDRAQLYENAKATDTEEAAELVKLIEATKLPFSEVGGINMDDPLVQAIYRIVHSDEGRAAAFEAAAEGRPALAGIDPLLAEALGVDYGKHNMTTSTAGDLVAKLMRDSGYKEAGRQMPLPEGCVAKTGQLWERKSS